MTIHNVGSIDSLVFYYVMLIMIILLTSVLNWQGNAIKLMVWMVFPHVFFTIMLFIFPNLYATIRPLIFVKNIMFEGYRTGLTGHYSTNAIYISISLLIFGSIVFQYGFKNVKKRYIVFFLFSVLALVLTTKRGPLIFSMVSIFITYILVDKKRISDRFIKALSIALTLLMAFYLLSDYIPELSKFIARFSEDGDSGRSVMYLLALKMFFVNPIFGQGTGAYRIQYFSSLAKDSDHMYLNAHNVYLQLLAENGIIGLILFLYASIFVLNKSIKLLRRFHMENNNNEIIMYITVAFQIYFLLYCLTGNPLYDSMMYIPYFIFCSVGYSFYIRGYYEK